jgi:HTH-type transcriptional regulator/antitoxin HipB
MLVRTPADIGAIIRDRRKQLKLDQATLAKRIGAGRQWVMEVEHGHPRAELTLVLRALDALNIRLDANTEQPMPKRPASTAVDIDSIVARAKNKRA